MTSVEGTKRALFSVGGMTVVILLCIAFVDRPAATWVAAHLRAQRPWFDGATHLVDPLVVLAPIGLIAAGLHGLSRRRLGPLGRALVSACVAIAVAVMLKEQAKYAFGRLWPETWVNNNPSWIGTGDFGFFPFHGGRGWASFPSGHTTVIAAPATTLAHDFPRLRGIFIAACVVVALGLLGADYHFVSDIVAGAGLGILSGLVVKAMAARANEEKMRSGPQVAPASETVSAQR